MNVSIKMREMTLSKMSEKLILVNNKQFLDFIIRHNFEWDDGLGSLLFASELVATVGCTAIAAILKILKILNKMKLFEIFKIYNKKKMEIKNIHLLLDIVFYYEIFIDSCIKQRYPCRHNKVEILLN